jgi:hypothetical protein
MASSGAHVVLGARQKLQRYFVTLPFWPHCHAAKVADLIHNLGCYRAGDLSGGCHVGVDGHVRHALEHPFGIQCCVGEGSGGILRAKGREGGCEAFGYGCRILRLRFADHDRGAYGRVLRMRGAD